MRIWTLHPKYLDTKGLTAVWRETLLAQKVLQGETAGYRHHPQLARFRAQPDPLAAVATYLQGVYEEACRRGYCFDASKIGPGRVTVRVAATRGQLLYEWQHLKAKLRVRDPKRYRELLKAGEPEPHPLFEIVEGGVADWEIR